MSRTVRRKNVFDTGTYYGEERAYTYEDDMEHAKLHGGWKSWQRYDWTAKQYVGERQWYWNDVAWGARKSVPKKGKAYKKGWWKYHSDAMRFWSGNKGPMWWIREQIQRPYRRKAKQEIRKALMDDEYEAIIRDKPKRGWWD